MDELKIFYEKHTKAIFYAVAFLLPFFVTLALFAVRKIYPFGDITFLKKDMYQQYTPFFYEYYRKLKSGDSLWYSWNAGLGSNFLAVIVYYLASPLNFLIVLFPEKYILEFMSYSVVVKTGLMGLCSSAYLSYHFKRHDPAMSFFSFAYVMSAYMAAYNWNVEWMDVLFAAPLVLLGLEKMSDGDSPLVYYLSLSYAIFTNYYLSIMLCIYVFIYFIVLQVIKGFNIKVIARFIFFSLLSGGTAAIYILPEYFALKFTTFTNIKFPKELTFYLSPPELMIRHFFGVAPETGLGHEPNIYCGILALVLIFVFAFSDKINLKNKLCHLILLVFFLFSFNLNLLNFIWHGFNYPDSLPARQGYLYTLLLVTISYEAFLGIREMKSKYFYISIVLPLILIVLTAFFSTEDTMDGMSKTVTIVSAVCMALLFLLYRSAPDKIHFPGNGQELVFRYAILFLFSAEVFCNMYITNTRTVHRTHYFSKYEDYKALNEVKKELDRENDAPLARADEVDRNVRNNSMTIDFSSLSNFSSTTNGLLIKYLNRYGFMNSRVFYLSDGSTAFTSMILGQRYVFVPENNVYFSEDIAKPASFSNGAALYEFNDSIPNGYVLRLNDETERKLFMPASDAEKIIDGEMHAPNSDLSPIEVQNSLMHDFNLSGTALMEYGTSDSGPIKNGPNMKSVEFIDDCHLYAYNASKTKGELKISMTDSSPDGKMTANKYRYIYDLGFHEKGTVATFLSEEKEDEDLNLEFYRLNPSVLDSFSEMLNASERLYDIEKNDNSLEGKIKMGSKGHLVLMVPYEPGWTLYVDGEKTPIELFDGLFISTSLPRGDHEIRIEFFPRGFKTGALISLLSLILSLLTLWYGNVLRKRAMHSRRRRQQ